MAPEDDSAIQNEIQNVWNQQTLYDEVYQKIKRTG